VTKVLITGGTGFLGKHLTPKLKEAGLDVWAPNSQELNLTNYSCMSEIGRFQPAIILHMAASCGGILANKNSPADFLRDNTQMALNVYEAARLYDISKVYSLGSVCMYPVNCPTPFKETDIWNGKAESTNFPYGQAKRTLMMLGETYRQQYGIGGAHLIPVNMFGTHDTFDLINSHVIPALINKFCHAVKNNKPIVECWGSGTGATREFLFVNDCADVIAKAVLTNFDHPEPINLGVGKDISIHNLAHLIAKLTGFQGKIIFNGTVSDGQPKRLLDVSRAKELLGWTATTSLTEGLIKTIKWYRANLMQSIPYLPKHP
jgi:GDP-L-fucose synthase